MQQAAAANDPTLGTAYNSDQLSMWLITRSSVGSRSAFATVESHAPPLLQGGRDKQSLVGIRNINPPSRPLECDLPPRADTTDKGDRRLKP